MKVPFEVEQGFVMHGSNGFPVLVTKLEGVQVCFEISWELAERLYTGVVKKVHL